MEVIQKMRGKLIKGDVHIDTKLESILKEDIKVFAKQEGINKQRDDQI